MTITSDLDRFQEFGATSTDSRTNPALLAGVVSFGLLVASYSPVSRSILSRTTAGQFGNYTPGLEESTSQSSSALEPEAIDLIRLLQRVHEDLLRTQSELDEDARTVLYENLWDLYD